MWFDRSCTYKAKHLRSLSPRSISLLELSLLVAGGAALFGNEADVAQFSSVGIASLVIAGLAALATVALAILAVIAMPLALIQLVTRSVSTLISPCIGSCSTDDVRAEEADAEPELAFTCSS